MRVNVEALRIWQLGSRCERLSRVGRKPKLIGEVEPEII